MPATCRVCQRVNPPEAMFCYYDGVALDAAGGPGGPIAVGRQAFSSPFVFASGRACRNFDEFVLACEQQWDEARDLLKKGAFQQFFAGMGRMDLAQTAYQASRNGNMDLGLDELLGKLPTQAREDPVLAVNPTVVNLGRIEGANSTQFVLELRNQGMGLLHGTASCHATDWLLIGETSPAPSKMIQCRDVLRLPIHVVGKKARAGNKPIEGRIILDTTGGKKEIIVRAEKQVTPFPSQPPNPLAGARTPRDVAMKARSAPKEAGPLFANGNVARWYETNGWTYPVQGPSADGLGAVQQFFEALGLVVPPKVQINTQVVQLQGPVGSSKEFSLHVSTVEKRPVFAHGTSPAAWIQVGQPVMRGQKAMIPVRVPSIPDLPGEKLTGKVHVQANGNQRFSVDVVLQIAGSPGQTRRNVPASPLPEGAPSIAGSSGANWLFDSTADPGPSLEIVKSPGPTSQRIPAITPAAPAYASQGASSPAVVAVTPVSPSGGGLPEVVPVTSVATRPAPRSSPQAFPDAVSPIRDGNPLKHLIPLGVALLVLLSAMLHDFLLEKEKAEDEPIFTAGGSVDSSPYINVHFHDGLKGDRFDDKEPNPTMRFGVVTLKENKKLTFDEWGRSNNTCVTVDSFTALYGSSSGTWVDLSSPLGKDAEGNDRVGRRSVWRLRNANVQITQEVERIRGDVSGKLDTCLVRYTLENKDGRSHRVGIRFLLDTFIGANDGVPFTIPGSSGLCDTKEQFQGSSVPAYIEALENEDLERPGTIARIQFRLGDRIDPPDRVLLGGWPDSNLQVLGYNAANAQQTLWEVPFTNIKELHEQGKKVGKNLAPDSAVTLYWNPAPLDPGQTRTVGFTYGLGDVSSDQGGGKLALTLGGRLVKGGELTLTAMVHQPAPDEVLRLDLPGQLELIEGSSQTSVPAVPPGSPRPISTVSWRLRAGDSGPCHVTVKSNKGAQQTLKLTLKSRGVFD